MSRIDLPNKLKLTVRCKQCKVNVKLWTKEAHTRRKPCTSWWRHLCKSIKPLCAQLCALFFV